MSAELILSLSNPQLSLQENDIERVTASAKLICTQALKESEVFVFTAPIGLLETDDLKWYLEHYYTWPVGLFKERAERIEKDFLQWGDKLLEGLTNHTSAQSIFQYWLALESEELLFTLNIKPDNTPESLTATSRLLGFPWELLHYNNHFLLAHQPAVKIRRNILNNNFQTLAPTKNYTSKIRILALSPRPLKAGYFDHRASIKPLIEAVECLGEQIELVRIKPRISVLKQELEQASAMGKPFHILHFDGHGIFDETKGKGALCFEHELDKDNLLPKAIKYIYANDLASLLTQHHIPLVFLEACQTAQSDEDPNASIATALLQAGIASVIAMSHSVLIETSRRFVSTFYQKLVLGETISSAVMAGQYALMQKTDRINIVGAGKLHLQDWFVPVLYQQQDSHLFKLSQGVNLKQKPVKLNLGDLPDTPSHSFIGRSLELFTLERFLETKAYAVIKGMGGIGKTTVAVELARWLVQSQQFDRCAFVSLEGYSHDRGVLNVLGKQLVNDKYTVAEYADDLQEAMQPIQQVLENESCLLILDNVESLLTNEEVIIKSLFQLINQLLNSNKKTRLLFTTRESLPAPFNQASCEVYLNELSEADAKTLVMQVMMGKGLTLKLDDQGKSPEEVNELVNAVGRHTRALILLAQELAIQGVIITTQNLQKIMLELEKKYKGQREYSLFSSVELSLQRLSIESQKIIKGLGVFQGGSSWQSIVYVLGLEDEVATQFIIELIQVGLAEEKDYGYLYIDPSLPNYLNLQLNHSERKYYQQRWFEILAKTIFDLYDQLHKDGVLSSTLTYLLLPNLMKFIHKLHNKVKAGQLKIEEVTDVVSEFEQLLSLLNKPQELMTVVNIRNQITKQIGKWSHAFHNSQQLNIERLLTQGDYQQACHLSKQLLQQAKQAGKNAYDVAEYDLSLTYFILGRSLNEATLFEEALPYLQKAELSFDLLEKEGEEMALLSLTEQGDCLAGMGKLSLAIKIFQKSLRHNKKLDNIRGVAVSTANLATVYKKQGNYIDALRSYEEVLKISQQLNDFSMLSAIYHQIAMVYHAQSQFDQAEKAYTQSLSIKVQHGNSIDEASTLLALASLYEDWDQLEQSVKYGKQAINIYTNTGHKISEGNSRKNIAITLIKLGYLDKARIELSKAIEYIKLFNHSTAPWQTWDVLYDLELADGNTETALQARQKAIDSYLSYRRNGGDNEEGAKRLCTTVLESIKSYQLWQTGVQQLITEQLKDENRQSYIIFFRHLQSVISGNFNLDIANDNEMNYQQVSELILLLEQLSIIKPLTKPISHIFNLCQNISYGYENQYGYILPSFLCTSIGNYKESIAQFPPQFLIL